MREVRVIAKKWAWLALSLPFLAGPLGCASNSFRAEELPEAPLAFVHRTTSEEHERLKLVKRNENQREGVVALDLQDPLSGGSQFQGHLKLLEPRTGDLTAARFALEGAIPLAWDPAHERLLFRSGERGPSRVILEWIRETGVVRPVLPGRAGIQADACYGPNGWKAFSIYEGEGEETQRKVYVLSPRGAVVSVSDGPWDGEVACNPGSDSLVFVRLPDRGQAQIVQLSWKTIQDGGVPQGRILVSGVDPSFSSDGIWLAFCRKTGGRWQLWKMRDDGSGKVALGRGVGDERSPSISPDGGYVAYSQTANDRTVLRVRRMDGSGDRPLLLEGVGDRPVW